MARSVVLETVALGMPWATLDPFLFCVHHNDAYPAGNAQLGPAASLAGRSLGSDFAGKDGWRMYHGDVVPGFPRHPHRGFETVTIARRGLIDHSDSLGAAARFGQGDVQWMTAGRGIVHSEMFPLLDPAGANPAELFQIWLNLPRASKMVDPHYTMLWANDVPTQTFGPLGQQTRVTLVAGALEGASPPPPPPRSWAAHADADVAIWTVQMDPGAVWRLPASPPGTNRMLYFFAGQGLRVGDHEAAGHQGIRLAAEVECVLENDQAPSELLVLQGRPIGEPVAQYGPFVMNTAAEIQQAFVDYRRTEFGGWPWPSDGPVHGREPARFAIHAGGRREEPGR
jgi:redox-sensitive bicupin YhaK (pirin superfamily)